MRTTLAAAAALGLATVTLAAAAPATAADGDAQLSVLHAVPGTTVDVYVDGALTLDDFTPGSLAGPLPVPAGSHQLAITAPDAADASSPIIGPVAADLKAGGDYTAVAHLTAAGKPGATLFTNDTSTVPAGQARLTVRHVAAAPAVDVLAGGKAVLSGLTNPKEASLEVPAGTVPAAVALAGTTQPVIGPADLALGEGTTTVVYAWGSAADGNLALATQTVGGMQQNPNGVPAGTTGAAAEPSPALVAGGILGVAALGGALVLSRRAARARA
ncbi:DUF4397 domain-containing protein [Tersicoccus sp. Bi-70]|uniref:DUF4397 domain-containing protein n=1 Tax=Tersicoccus sp. Bi-70 TaxID=1897634 RepID=UPI00097546D2|nr:DUF4397 domain-containing protein [Tersicoccus sp. Bi-70]OMH34219.1 hypothetical protein BGP79_03545 [Tersicoccus sp. Bi-70]